jgi:hypothetical protein
MASACDCFTGGAAPWGAARAPRAEYIEAMEALSAGAFAAYRNLVFETLRFEDFFWESTVISEIAELNIGTRPASRSKSRSIDTLRAIPSVFFLGTVPADAAGLVWIRLCGAVLAGSPRERAGAAAGDVP